MASKCECCPECVVLFDDSGYHGSVPDSHSETCKRCLRENAEMDISKGKKGDEE